MIFCIHHNDNDGRCAAAVVGRYAREEDEPIIYRCIDYKDKLDLALVPKDASIFIVDFSLMPADMEALKAHMTPPYDITWIDHHKSAQVFEYGTDMPGIRDFTEPGKSGARLTWKYLFPSEPAPEAVALVSDYDTWTHSLEPRDTQFKEGLIAAGSDPTSPMWRVLLEPDSQDAVSRLCEAGEHILMHQAEFMASMDGSYGYTVEFHGLRCRVLNVYGVGSAAFGESFEQYDACIAYIRTKDKYSVSMYTAKPKVDVAAICVEHGGGGHTKAAGFVCNTLPF